MESKHYSLADMEAKCIVRFKDLKYMGAGEKKKEGPISPEVYKMLAAPAFAITAPEFDNGPWGEARVKVPDYVNIIAELPPGGGVPLHMHAKTIETFMALTGKWKLQWGDKGEYRFENVGTEKAYLLVLISGGTHDMDDLIYAPSVGKAIEDKFGKSTREHVEKVGFKFTAGISGAHAHMK
jgi:hypothetical protein